MRRSLLLQNLPMINRYGSIALQSGELESQFVTDRIENLLHKIKELSNGELGVTLSVGEQDTGSLQKMV